MSSSEAEAGSPPPAMAPVIDELIKGRQLVATVATLLLVDRPESQTETTKLLLEEAMSTISKAIAILECVNSQQQEHMGAQFESPSSDVTIKGKRKIHSTRKPASRKRGNSYSCTRITSATIEDGHTWRKYGQKEIFSAKHPRSYFRCTYKYDQGCKATRQVQKSEDDPSLYVITYFGEHTCEASKENNPRHREPCVVSFEYNKINDIKQEEIAFSSFPSHKQENEEEVASNLTSIDSLSNGAVELHKPSITGLEPGWSDSFSGLNYSINCNDLEFMDLEDMLLGFELNEFFAW